MKARIFDKLALEAINPAALRAYVVYEGWQRTESFGQFSEVYARPKDRTKSEVIIPASSEIADYASAVSEALKFIARFEDRDELALYGDLVRADRDVIRIRAPEADDDGSIGIDPGVGIVQHARDLLASAACAAFEPRRSYHLGKVQKAEEYMRRVRLGQTEHGSFVVTLLAPIPGSPMASLRWAITPLPCRCTSRITTSAAFTRACAARQRSRKVSRIAFGRLAICLTPRSQCSRLSQ